MRQFGLSVIATAALAASFSVTAASAQTLSPDVTALLNNEPVELPAVEETTDKDGKTIYKLSTEGLQSDDVILNLNVEGSPNPYILGSVAVTNNSALAQTFTFSFSQPVAVSYAAPNEVYWQLAGSAVGSGSVYPISGGDVFEGFVDGVSVQTLLPDGSFSLTAPGSIDPTSNPALEGTIYTAPALTSSLRTDIEFTVDPGTTASFNFNWKVEDNIPEPATGMMVLGLGALAGLVRTRRAA